MVEIKKVHSKHNKIIRLSYFSLVGLLSILIGALFIYSSLSIYYNYGGYDINVINLYFSKFNWLVYINIVLIIGGFILAYFVPGDKKEINRIKNVELLKLYEQNINKGSDNYSLHFEKYKKEKIKDYIFLVSAIIVTVTSFIMSLLFLIKRSGYVGGDGDTILKEVLAKMFYLLPWITDTILIWVSYLIYLDLTATKKLEIVKNIAVLSKKTKKNMKKQRKDIILLTVRLAVLTVAIVFIFVGVFNGGFMNVLANAKAVCKACIGMA